MNEIVEWARGFFSEEDSTRISATKAIVVLGGLTVAVLVGTYLGFFYLGPRLL